jgi:hypothetical protein
MRIRAHARPPITKAKPMRYIIKDMELPPDWMQLLF